MGAAAIAALAAVAGAIVAALGAYVAAARRLSGKVSTSEAGELWQESAAIRQDYRDRLHSADDRQARLEERVAKLEQRNSELAAEVVQLMREALELQRTIGRLRDERDEALGAVEHLQATIKGRRTDDPGP